MTRIDPTIMNLFWLRIAKHAREIGIDDASWKDADDPCDAIARAVLDKMDRRCLACDNPADQISIAVASGGPSVVYIHCGKHAIDQIEALIAEQQGDVQ
jgi:hypothetical protein